MASRASLKLLRLARGNDSQAQLDLGRLYLSGGEGIAPNQEAALMWLSRAADQGLREASRLIARSFSPAHASAPEALLAHYEAAAAAGDALGALHAGMVWSGREGALALARSRQFLEIAAQAGVTDAQVMLARLLEHSTQPAEAAVNRLLSKAAIAGSDEAMRALAERAWSRRDASCLPAVRAAAAGSGSEPVWWFRLGVMLRDATQDEGLLVESAQWLGRASDAGLPLAQFELGRMLAGLCPAGVRRNYKRAARLLAAALDAGVAEAGVALAILHDNPRFENRDASQAVDALERSAKMGCTEAQFQLGRALAKRKGVKARGIDGLVEQARYWFEAARGGHREAAQALRTLASAPPEYDDSTRAYQATVIQTIGKSMPQLAMRLRLMAVFGLSKAEMLCVAPSEADHGFCLAAGEAGNKRVRLMLIERDEHRLLIEDAKRILVKDILEDEAYAVRYRKLLSAGRRFEVDWARFTGSE